jgi:hypothetical protein
VTRHGQNVRVTPFILVHSPLVGPSTWRWVAETLVARGHRVTVPAVAPETASLGWEAFADAVAAQAGQEEHAVLVGHSGAGPLLPQIQARARGELDALVFVDAAVPPAAGETDLVPGWFLAELRAMAPDGLLPPWSEWFGAGVMRELIPDEGRRAAICGELPRLPVSFFASRVQAPSGWATARCGYVLLSEPYAGEAAEAARRGWPVAERPGAHLGIVTRPALITDAILSVSGLADPRPAPAAAPPTAARDRGRRSGPPR